MKRISFLFLSVFLFFVSCSQNINEILNSNHTIIYDYSDETTKPSQRLSVFVQSDGDVRRYQKMKLYSDEKQYEWTTDNLVLFTSKNASYAGYPNFIVPKGEYIPEGFYELTMINADEDENIASFTITYDKELNNKSLGELKESLKTLDTENHLCIYDENDKVIFYGPRPEELQTEADIWIKYKNSKYYYEMYFLKDKSVMWIMPKKIIITGDANE